MGLMETRECSMYQAIRDAMRFVSFGACGGVVFVDFVRSCSITLAKDDKSVVYGEDVSLRVGREFIQR